MEAAGVKASAIQVVRVPGSNELPSALQLLSATGSFDVLIALGVVFLLGQAGLLSGRAFGLLWPSALIVLGLWLMVRRIVEGKGGPEA